MTAPTALLSSFDEPIDALVVGAGGGLGSAFVHALANCDNARTVHAWSRRAPHHLAKFPNVIPSVVDPLDEASLENALGEIERLTLVIIATGVLHNQSGLSPEKSTQALNPEHMLESFRINTVLPALIIKHAYPKFPRRERAMLAALSARVGSISDNRLGGWYSYRASKAALNQVIKCTAIEWGRTHPLAACIGLHPGTVDTDLSRPFQARLKRGHDVFAPDEAVTKLLSVIDGATPEQSGSVLAWDGSPVPA